MESKNSKVRFRDAVVRRERILLAAARVFLKKGFRLASMEDIAAAADVAIGTIYHHFRNKEHLFTSLEAENERALNARLRAVATKPLPPQFALLAIARAYVDHFLAHPEMLRIRTLFRYEHEPTGSARLEAERRMIDRLTKKNLWILVRKIREGQALGFFRRTVDPVAVAIAHWASLIGLLIAGSEGRLLKIAGMDLQRLVSTAAYLNAVGLNSDASVPPVSPIALAKPRGDVSLTDLQDVLRSAPWITPRMIFAGMNLLFQPKKARRASERFLYRIGGRNGGTWSVEIEHGKLRIREGLCESPNASFEISDSNFIRLVTGDADATDLILDGHLKISGDLQCAARLPTYFRPDAPKPAPPEMRKRLARALVGVGWLGINMAQSVFENVAI